MLPETGKGIGRDGGPRRVALLGRPNVGKSSLLNKLAGGERVVVDDVAGTTVDPVDELVDIKGTWWWFVDTAGVRRKAKQSAGHEYYATLRTQSALDRSEVAIVLIDASEPVSERDVGVCRWRSTLAERSSWPSTSGIWSMKIDADTWIGKSIATWRWWRGHRG